MVDTVHSLRCRIGRLRAKVRRATTPLDAFKYMCAARTLEIELAAHQLREYNKIVARLRFW